MAAGPRFDMKDPAVQEKIRRGPHEYVVIDGVRQYVPLDGYKHQAYPKYMDRSAQPIRKAYKTDAEHQVAVKEWEEAITASLVSNKAEEDAWLAEHAPIEPLEPQAVPVEAQKPKKAKSA
jgi:hypothetical protein